MPTVTSWLKSAGKLADSIAKVERVVAVSDFGITYILMGTFTEPPAKLTVAVIFLLSPTPKDKTDAVVEISRVFPFTAP